MSTTKKKPPAMARAKQQDQVNKKALIWAGAIFGVIVLVVGIMLVLNI